MKKLFILMTCILFTVVMANAQKADSATKAKVKARMADTSRDQNMKGGMISPENMKALDLNEDQKKQIYELHTKAKQDKDKIKNDASLTEDQKKEKLKAVDKAYRDKSESMLNAEQKEKLKKIKENKKGTKEPAGNK